MKRIRLAELNSDIRDFVTDALEGEGITIEDDAGRACGGLVPFIEATHEERRRAWKELESVQDEVGRSLAQKGVGEEDIVNLILEDD